MAQKQTVGGGFKKVLYTLDSVRRIGVRKSAKALSAKNACKACGLGMGGLRGGMVNELDEFPSVCNKSIQAQLTDIQAAIPDEIFQHTLTDFKELSGREMENLGRLNTPLYKKAHSDTFEPVDWGFAMQLAAQRFRAITPQRSFFYSSGRSSNEAAFLLQLMARCYGSSHINNCSYYCHQATGVGLASTIGTGTATVELADLGLTDLVFLIGANPSSNHPRLIHQLKQCRDRGGDVVVINPAKEPGLVKFAVPKSPKSMLIGGDYIASDYLQPRAGSDLALLKGIAKALLELEQIDYAYLEKYCLGYEQWLNDIESLQWSQVEELTGLEKQEIERVASRYAKSDNTVFAWGMGITHHINGVENVETIAALALLRGMIGKPGAGLLPLRGHSNVQGVGSVGVKPVLAEDVFVAIESEFDIKLSRDAGMDTLACLQAAERGEIEAAMMMGGNLFAASPETHWAAKALDNIPFKCYLTTTMNTGHVNGLDNSEVLILPVTARDEEPQPTTQESMFNYVRLSEGGIERLDNVRSEIRVLADLAALLMPESKLDFSAFRQHQKIREAIARIIPGMSELRDIEHARKEFHIKGRIKHRPEFSTETGKAQFREAKHLPPNKKLGNEYTLMTVRSEGQFNSIVYEEQDTYRNMTSRWIVMMNSEDMRQQQLAEGDKVNLVSEVGRMDSVAVHAFDLPRGDMMAYFPEANVLVGQQVDPRSRTPAFKSVRVKLQV